MKERITIFTSRRRSQRSLSQYPATSPAPPPPSSHATGTAALNPFPLTEPMLSVLCRRVAPPRAKPRRAFICSLTPLPKAQIAIFILDRISLLRRTQPLPSLTTSSHHRRRVPITISSPRRLSLSAASMATPSSILTAASPVFSLDITVPNHRLSLSPSPPRPVLAAVPAPHRPQLPASLLALRRKEELNQRKKELLRRRRNEREFLMLTWKNQG
ncbi:hypothetical protein M0R45_019790 [Rubus argutus]|uniref:Uncharacterized protein n=1 Tax=Rubus argutus TaxID=59490 RepID=A0AAW1X7A8_RUBAR